MKEIKNPYLDIPNEMHKENNTKDCYEHRKRDLTCAQTVSAYKNWDMIVT